MAVFVVAKMMVAVLLCLGHDGERAQPNAKRVPHVLQHEGLQAGERQPGGEPTPERASKRGEAAP